MGFRTSYFCHALRAETGIDQLIAFMLRTSVVHWGTYILSLKHEQSIVKELSISLRWERFEQRDVRTFVFFFIWK